MSSSLLDQKREAWCQPISAEAFGGEPSRYEERYEKLLAELGKAESLQGGVTDWNVVYECADSLLCTKTKDMTVLSALCVALFHKQRFAGLAAGLAAYHFLLGEHSDHVFPNPKRPRGRAGAYSWLTERLVRELEQVQAQIKDHQDVALCLQHFEGLDRALRDQLGDQHPRVGPLTRRLTELLEQSRPPAPPPEPERSPEPPPPAGPAPAPASAPAPLPAPPSVPAPAAASVPAPAPVPAPPPVEEAPVHWTERLPESFDDEDEVRGAVSAVAELLKRMSLLCLELDPGSSLGYALGHAGSFLGLVPDGERTQRGPNPRSLRELQEAAKEERWRDVLEQGIALLREGDWDLNAERYLAQALQQLQQDSAVAVLSGQALGAHVGLGELLHSSGETEAWLRKLGGRRQERDAGSAERAAVTGAGDQAEVPSRAVEEARLLAETVSSAVERASQDGLEAGCAVIQDVLRRVGSSSMRFRLRLALAGLCVREEAADLARPMLQQLYQELENPVRSWEPELLVEVISALLECNRQLQRTDNPPEGLEQESAQLMTILSRTDPQAAFRERAKSS